MGACARTRRALHAAPAAERPAATRRAVRDTRGRHAVRAGDRDRTRHAVRHAAQRSHTPAPERPRAPGRPAVPLPGGLALESSGIPGLAERLCAREARHRRPHAAALAERRPLRLRRDPPAERAARRGHLHRNPYDARSHAPVVDVWVLDTRTAAFTHVPGFPAAEDFKQLVVAWAPGNRPASRLADPATRRPRGDRDLAAGRSNTCAARGASRPRRLLHLHPPSSIETRTSGSQ